MDLAVSRLALLATGIVFVPVLVAIGIILGPILMLAWLREEVAQAWRHL